MAMGGAMGDPASSNRNYLRFVHLKILELTELARAKNLLHLVRSS